MKSVCLQRSCGHYYYDSTYSPYCKDLQLISKQERKARKWAYFTLVPFKILKEKISKGLDIYELADYFEVSIKYMNDCLKFYIEKYGTITS